MDPPGNKPAHVLPSTSGIEDNRAVQDRSLFTSSLALVVDTAVMASTGE